MHAHKYNPRSNTTEMSVNNEIPKVISKETIKPSVPTPNHLRRYNLSLMDQFAPNFYLPMVFFYPDMGCDSPSNATKITTRLKQALSETLTRYYPFAGRMTNKVSIDCNDQGVEFYEARIDCKLSHILKNPEPETVDVLYPKGLIYTESYGGSLLVIQVTFFKCGGMSISKLMSHKIGDGSTAASFLNEWASAARGSMNELLPPEFISKTLEPLIDPSIVLEGTKTEYSDACVTRRFVFNASKLADLKATVTGSGVSNPSRVDIVRAIIYKCAITASSKAKPRISSRPYLFLQPVNLRPRTSPPMQVNSVGNFAWISPVMVNNIESQKELHNLVLAVKNGMEQFNHMFGKNLTVNECYSTICDTIKIMMNKKVNDDDDDGGVNVYKGSSLCRFPFDGIDFGWGKPLWAGLSSSSIKNSFLLKDAKDFGIEVWVSLEEEEMAIFECDEELLAFATLNPSVHVK